MFQARLRLPRSPSPKQARRGVVGRAHRDDGCYHVLFVHRAIPKRFIKRRLPGATGLRCGRELPAVLVDGVARQVDLVVPEDARPARVELDLREQPRDGFQGRIRRDVADVLGDVVEHDAPVVEPHAQLEARQRFDGFYSPDHFDLTPGEGASR